MTKKWVVLLFVSLLVLTACWDQRELSDISVITGMAVDKGEQENYKVTFEGINSEELSSRTASGNTASIVFTIEGNTLSEITQKMNIGASKNVIYSHMRTLVIGEEVAREGILQFLDYLERDREIRDDFNLIIARGVKASEVLKVNYAMQKVSTMKIHTQLASMARTWGGDPDVRLNDVIRAWRSPGRDPVMAAVSVIGNPEKGSSLENMQKIQPDAIVVLNSLAIFKDNKLQGFLPLEDTRNFLWTQGKIRRTALSVPCKDNNFASIRIFHSNTKTKVRLVDTTPIIDMNINVEAYLDELQCKDDLTKLSTYAKFEKLSEDEIKKSILITINKAQKDYQTDIFGFGDSLYRQHYQEFKKVEKDWDYYFKNAKVNLNVKVHLRRSGNRTKSLLTK